MEDINISNKRWKYTDKQFCGEVAALQKKDTNDDGTPDFVENSEAYPNLIKLVERKEQMKKDVCNSECPTQFRDCKCYKTDTSSKDGTNNVHCAMVQDGFAFACPETCCNEGLGCPEPGRTLAENDAPEVPPGSEPVTVGEALAVGEDGIMDKLKKLKPEEWFGIIAAIVVVILLIMVGPRILIFMSETRG